MQVPPIFVQKKTVILEVIILVVFLFGGYYLYGIMSEQEVSTAQVSANEGLLGKNLLLFLKAKNQDKLSFKDVSFMDTLLIKQLQDFSETISANVSRGRLDPFIPYASSRSIR